MEDRYKVVAVLILAVLVCVLCVYSLALDVTYFYFSSSHDHGNLSSPENETTTSIDLPRMLFVDVEVKNKKSNVTVVDEAVIVKTGGAIVEVIPDYTKIMINLRKDYLNEEEGAWDCSNISWDLMENLQERGYDAWYCGGWYQDDREEGHAWVVIKRDEVVRLDPLMSPFQELSKEYYGGNYEMWRCSNKTYFDEIRWN